MKDCYSILNVKQDMPLDEIKSSYRKLLKKYHPDTYIGDKQFAQAKTIELNKAYAEILKSYKNIFSMNLKEVHFLNNRFKKIIYTNEELIKVWNFKKIQKKVKREEKNKNIYLLNSFNSVFHSSNRLWIITTKSGKIRKFKNFETYLKAKPYFNKSNKEAV